MSQTVELPRVQGPGSGLGGSWHVIVRNDDHNTFDGVAARSPAPSPGSRSTWATAIADRIHNTGLAIVWSGHRELAEQYWEQLRDHGLTMAPLEQG